MHKAVFSIAVLLFVALAGARAQAQMQPVTVNVRYNQHITNTPAGNCGCFGLEGVGLDASLQTVQLRKGSSLGLALDFGAVHANSTSVAPSGLTLTTLTAGPRYNLPQWKVQSFAQALFGFAHGSGSDFPKGNSLSPTANGFAFDLGAGADYPVNPWVSVRVLQLDYMRTALPNNTNNWQNHLRAGFGLTLHFPAMKTKK